jgi:ATP-dependent helicase HepA
MVAGAIDLLLEGEQGNAAFFVDDVLPPRTVLLECVFVLECVAERSLAPDRFLPPTPLHVIVDTKLQVREGYAPSGPSLAKAADRAVDFGRYRKFLTQLVPPMLERAEASARQRAEAEIAQAMAQAQRQLAAEAERLAALRRVNPGVRAEEIAAVEEELAALAEALPQSRPRLDAVRFVCGPDFLALR